MKYAIIGIIGGCILLAASVFGIKSFVGNIYDRTDCERFNIDHIELRTNTNIPDVTDATCECSEGTKTSTFILDIETEERLNNYALKNGFKLVNGLYTKSGENKSTIWECTLNPDSKELTFLLNYISPEV